MFSDYAMTDAHARNVPADDTTDGSHAQIRAGLCFADEGLGAQVATQLRSARIDVVLSVGRVADLLDSDRAGAVKVAVFGADVLDEGDAAALGSFVRARQQVPLVVVSSEGSERAVRRAVRIGATGLVLSATVDQTIVPAVIGVGAGLICFPRDLGGHAAKPVLTTREKQIMGMIVLGMSNQEIATRLHVTQSTVKSHLFVTFSKLGVRTRSEAAAAIVDPVEGFGTGILRIST